MKKTLKKMLVSIMIVLLLFNFMISGCSKVYADDVEDGIADVMGGFIGILTWVPRAIALAIGFLINILSAEVVKLGDVDGDIVILTPYEIFFNKTTLLSVDFFEDANGTVGDIRMAVAQWYYFMRLIAIAILLLVLLYVGIRMVLSTVASEKAMYKKMLYDWVSSLALVFLLQYIMIFVISVNDILVDAIGDGMSVSLKDTINNIAITALGISINAMGATIVYCVIAGQIISFLFLYMKRMITVGFLIIISPLISITYSIDKMGDGKAQALNAWLKEFIFNVLIQPFHCILYSAFVKVAFDILTDPNISGRDQLAASILAIICIMFVKEGEKIVRKIFGFENASSLKDMAGSAVAAGALLKNAKNIGSSARKGVNFAKEKKNAFVAARDKDRANKYLRQGKAKDMTEAMKMAKDNRISNRLKRAPGIRTLRKHSENRRSERMKAREAKIEHSMEDAFVHDNMREQYMEKHGNDKNAEANFQKMMGDQTSPEYKELRKNADKAYNAMKENKDSQEYRKYRYEAEKKNTSTVKKVSGAVGRFKNSETGKFTRQIGRDFVSSGVGLALGGMASGTGMGAMESFMLGKGMYNATQEFMKSSTGHLADEASNYMKNGEFSSKEDVQNHMYDVKGNGDNGEYEANSELVKNLLRELEKAINDPSKFASVKGEINYGVAANPTTFNLQAVLDKYDCNNSTVRSAAQNYTDMQYDANLYRTIQNGEAMGMSVDTLAGKASRKVELTGIPISTNSNNQTEPESTQNRDSSNGGNPSRDNPSGDNPSGEVHEQNNIESYTYETITEKEVNNIFEEISDGKTSFNDVEKHLNSMLSNVNSSNDFQQLLNRMDRKIEECRTSDNGNPDNSTIAEIEMKLKPQIEQARKDFEARQTNE